MAEGAGSDSSEAVDCPNCGTGIHATDVYCSSCGTQVRITDPDDQPSSGDDGTTADDEEDPYGESREAFRRRVHDKLVGDWEIKHDRQDSVVLVDRSYGEPWVHVVLAFATGGFGNLVYAWYKYNSDADHLVMRRGETTTEGEKTAPAPEEYEDESPPLNTTLGGLGVLLLGIYLFATSPLALGSVMWGLFLVVAGLYIMPQVRRRLGDRHPLTTFGRTKSTDETVVQNPDVPCTVCLSPIESGIKRTYKEEQVFAGVPLYTIESGENHYCQSCTFTDVSPTSVDAVDDVGTSSELSELLVESESGTSEDETTGSGSETDEATAEMTEAETETS